MKLLSAIADSASGVLGDSPVISRKHEHYQALKHVYRELEIIATDR